MGTFFALRIFVGSCAIFVTSRRCVFVLTGHAVRFAAKSNVARECGRGNVDVGRVCGVVNFRLVRHVAQM